MTYTYAYIIKNIYMNIYIHTELFFVFVYRNVWLPTQMIKILHTSTLVVLRVNVYCTW